MRSSAMNALNICLTITALAGTVCGQLSYSLIPGPNVILPSTFPEDVSASLQNAAKSSMDITAEDNEAELIFALRQLLDRIRRNQRHGSNMRDPSASEKKISKRSIVDEEKMGLEKQSTSNREHRIIPVAHQRLVHQVRPVTSESENNPSNVVTRQPPTHQVRPNTYQNGVSRALPIISNVDSVTNQLMQQVVAVTPA